ncbi:MAG: TonB-dependent receptor [Sphingomonadaceae bacterium]|nr:TonB-dependent receptor [Sphingomonadaceae bacterium]
MKTDEGRRTRSVAAGLMAATATASVLAAAPAIAQDAGSAASASDSGSVQLGPVRVEGDAGVAPAANPYADPEAPYKADRLSSGKFAEPLLNTARTATVVTKEALEDKQATTLRELARSTAGVTLGSGEGGNAFGDRFFIRGFDARNDVFVDGVRDPGVAIRENFDVEQVEILRGPASSFAGRGTTGGALNIVTKQAQDGNFLLAEGTGGFESGERRGTIDVNRQISPTLDVRLNGMIQYGGVAGRDFATDNRWGVAGAATFKPTDDFTLKANFAHSRIWGQPDFGVPYNQVARRPVTSGDVSRYTYYGIANRDFTESTQDVGTLDAEWRLNDSVTLENKFRGSHSLLNYIGTIPENPSASGATAPYSSSATHFSGFVQLNAQSRYEPVTVIADQPQATFKFDTGEIRNTLVVGGEFSHEKIDINSYTGFTSELTTGPVAFTSSGAPIVSVFDPTHYLFGSGVAHLGTNPQRYRVDTKAGYLIETANYRDLVILNAGVRYDDYDITSANNTSSRKAHSGITSYNVGLVVKPSKIGSVYVAYATAADPVGDELDATASAYGGLSPTQNALQIFGPQRSRSIEVGTKWELFDRHLLASAAAFQTRVTNARETAPAGLPGYTSGQIVAGAIYRVRGLDFELAGNITPQWSVLGGLVIMDPKVRRSINPLNDGLQLANIAPTSFNLLTKYQLTRRFELGGQAVYASQIKGGGLLAANGNVPYPGTPRPTILPSYWRFDVFAEARVNEHLELKVYAQNLFNKTYYDSLYQSAQPFIAVAPGRNILVEAAIKF